MRVLFCGGGTGGHVYPALAVADAVARGEGQEVRSAKSQLATLYIGTEGEIEETLVPRAGISLETIPGGGLHGVGAVRFVRNLLWLMRGFFQAWRIIGRFRPDVLFLTGGYVSAPVALATWLRRRPILVYLPDVEPGLAIRLLSRIATRVAVSVEASCQYFPAWASSPSTARQRPTASGRGLTEPSGRGLAKVPKATHAEGSPKSGSGCLRKAGSAKIVVTGYPLRSEFHQVERGAARAHFDIPPEDKVLLVFGGSRGARTINRALGAILESVLAQAQVIHISGRLDAEECRARREALPTAVRARYHLFDYLHEMAQALAAADLVVARAGAATLGEFPFFGLPAILVPYPYAWRYQKVNAEYLADRGAAVWLNDGDMHERLWPTIEALLQDEGRLKQMRDNARALARPDAATRLADLLTQLAHNSKLERKGSDYGGH